MSIEIRDVRAICTAPEGINLVAVKIETNEPELYGVGCATFAHRYSAVVTVINDYLRPFLIGKDPSNIEDIWQSVMGMSYWRNGPVLNNALSGVDMALWDIKGKMAGMPLYQLFGGKCRAAIPCYTHAEGDSVDVVLERVAALKELGYRKIRVQVGGYGGKNPSMHRPENSPPGAYFDPKSYIRNVLNLMETLHVKYAGELEFCHDTHERLSPIDAVNFAKELEPYHLLFLEDALPPEQSDWFRILRQQCATPLAMGELFNNPQEWKHLVQEHLIDYIRIHVSQIGGITPARKVIAFCDAYGVRTAWHGPVDMTPIGHAVNAFSWGGAFCLRWRAPARCAAGFYLSRSDTLFYGRLLPSLSVPHSLLRKQLLLPAPNFFRLVQSFEMPLYRPSWHLFPRRPLSPANHHTHCGSAARAYIPAHSPADPADPVQSFS